MSSVFKNFCISVATFSFYELSSIVASKIWDENKDDNTRNNVPMETIRVGILIPVEYLLSKYFDRPIRITSYSHNY